MACGGHKLLQDFGAIIAEPGQLECCRKVEILNFLQNYATRRPTDWVRHNGYPKSTTNEIQQIVHWLSFLNDAQREPGLSALLRDGVNPFGPQPPRELDKRFAC
jgi:hypothetical protein